MPGIPAVFEDILVSTGWEAVSLLGENQGLKMYFCPDLT